jgi:hypothetical protein
MNEMRLIGSGSPPNSKEQPHATCCAVRCTQHLLQYQVLHSSRHDSSQTLAMVPSLHAH